MSRPVKSKIFYPSCVGIQFTTQLILYSFYLLKLKTAACFLKMFVRRHFHVNYSFWFLTILCFSESIKYFFDIFLVLNLHFNFSEKQGTLVLRKFELQTVVKLRRNWFEIFNFLHFKLCRFKVTITDHMCFKCNLLEEFYFQVDRKVSTSDWKCQRSCNEKLMKRKDYWHKLKGDRDELQTQLTTNIINNFMFQLTADWLTLLLCSVWSMLLVIFY